MSNEAFVLMLTFLLFAPFAIAGIVIGVGLSKYNPWRR